MTINDIINSLSYCIDEIFNKDERKYNIYTEHTEQGFEKPCFFINPISQSRKQELDNGFKKHIKLDILFFPKGNKKNLEITEVMEIALDELAVLKIGNKKIKGRNIDIEVVDEVLHFIVDYDIHLVKASNIELMRKLYYIEGKL